MQINILMKNIGHIKDVEEMILFMDILEEEANKSLLKDPIACSIISGFIINHMNNCTNYNCVLRMKELYLPLTNRLVQVPDDLKEMSINEVVLIHLLREIYNDLGDKFAGNIKYHYSYILFIVFRIGNPKLALFEIEKSTQLSISPQQEFSLFLLKQYANDRLLNNQYYIANYAVENISILDIIDVVVFDILSYEFEKGIEECAKMKISFWTSLRENTIFIEDVYIKGKNYITKKLLVSKIHKKLSKITKNNRKINDIYKAYNEFICDDLSLNDLENSKKGSMEQDKDDLVHARFFDDTAFIIIDSSLDTNLGNINSYNKAVCKLLKYDKDELLGKNISVIQTDSIGKVHNRILVNFIQTGKNRLIGKNTPCFAKDKQKFLIPIHLLIMPLPSYNSRSEILGLFRERKTEGNFIIINEYGIIESFSRELKKYDENFEFILNGTQMFIFFIFPELLYTNDIEISHARRPTFIDEKKMVGLTIINGYFDSEMIRILKLIESENSNKNKEIRDKKMKDSKLMNEAKMKTYNDYLKICNAIRDYCKTVKEFKKNLSLSRNMDNSSNIPTSSSNSLNSYKLVLNKIRRKSQYESPEENIDRKKIGNYMYFPNTKSSTFIAHNTLNKDFTEYYELYLRYRNLLESELENDKIFTSKRVYKRQFIVKISPFRFNYSEIKGKIYIIEFHNAPNEVDNNIAMADEKDNTEKEDDDVKDTKNNLGINEETGSVASGLTNNVSIHNVVQRLREQNNKRDNFHKSSYMNWLLYALILIISGFIIYYMNHVWKFTYQQNILTEALYNYSKFKENLYNLRKYFFIKNLTLTKQYDIVIPINETVSLDRKLIQITSNLKQLNRNETYIMISISDPDYYSKLSGVSYPINGRNQSLSDVIDNIILYSVNIALSANKNNTQITEILSLFNLTESNLIEINNNSYRYIEYIIQNSKEIIQNILSSKVDTISEFFEMKNSNTLNILFISEIIISSIVLLIMLFIFLILKERYQYNKTILEFLKQIDNCEIDEIVSRIDNFLKIFKSSNALAILQMSANNHKIPTYDNVGKKKEKTIMRKENIFISFFLNISLIIILIIVYLLLEYFLTLMMIQEYDSLFTFNTSLYESYLNNIKSISDIRDVYISNNTALYNNENKVSSYINSTYYQSKIINDLLISKYSFEKNRMNSNLRDNFDRIFFSDLCQVDSVINLNCSEEEKRIFNKGLRYALSYYNQKIEEIIKTFNPFDNTNLFNIYIMNSNYFVNPAILVEEKLSIIYNYLTGSLESSIQNLSSFFFVIILCVSCLSIFLIYMSIFIKWNKYVNKIKLEEYMSNKIIAEIPMYIIQKNRVIREHLLEFANYQ